MIGPQPGDKTKKYTVTQASFKRPLYLLRSVTRPDLQYSIGLYCNKVLRYLQYCQRICNLESKNWRPHIQEVRCHIPSNPYLQENTYGMVVHDRRLRGRTTSGTLRQPLPMLVKKPERLLAANSTPNSTHSQTRHRQAHTIATQMSFNCAKFVA